MVTQTEPTVRELAAVSLASVRVFENLGIDYCCGGQRPFGEACREKGLDPDTVRAQLSAAQQPQAGEVDWTSASLRQLIDHIVARHHNYLREEMPRISERLAKVTGKEKYAREQQMLVQVREIFEALRAELDLHLMKEERMLFPYIAQFEDCSLTHHPAPQPPFGSLRNPIGMMEYEHDSAGDALRQLRDLTQGYAVPDYACPTYRAMMEGLAEFEQDLHLHIHLENNILHRRAAELENQFAG